MRDGDFYATFDTELPRSHNQRHTCMHLVVAMSCIFLYARFKSLILFFTRFGSVVSPKPTSVILEVIMSYTVFDLVLLLSIMSEIAVSPHIDSRASTSSRLQTTFLLVLPDILLEYYKETDGKLMEKRMRSEET